MEQSARAAPRQSQLARGSAFARRRKCRLPCNYGAGAVTGRAAEAERGGVIRRTAAHTAARTCVGGTTGARTTRLAALGRHDDSLAARRSLSVAGVGSDRADCFQTGDATQRGTRNTAHTTRRARVSTARSANARRRRRRSIGTTTRSRLGARSASPASALTEPNRRCDEESKRRGDVTRHTTAHTTACACVDGTIGARTTRSAALGLYDDSLAARRSLGVAGAGSDRAEPGMRRGKQEAR